MRSHFTRQEILHTLEVLATTHARTVNEFRDRLTALSRELGLPEIDCGAHLASAAVERCAASAEPPVADTTTLSVHWNGSVCFLGNTLLFRFYQKLSQRPNRYFTYAELLADVWGAPRSHETIHNVVKRLRDRLLKAKMGPIAQAIDGSEQGHYALRIDWIIQQKSKPNQSRT